MWKGSWNRSYMSPCSMRCHFLYPISFGFRFFLTLSLSAELSGTHRGEAAGHLVCWSLPPSCSCRPTAACFAPAGSDLRRNASRMHYHPDYCRPLECQCSSLRDSGQIPTALSPDRAGDKDWQEKMRPECQFTNIKGIVYNGILLKRRHRNNKNRNCHFQQHLLPVSSGIFYFIKHIYCSIQTVDIAYNSIWSC